MKVFIMVTKDGFVVVGHAHPMATGEFQWYLTDDPNMPCQQAIEEAVHKSIVINNEWIQKNGLHKWLTCHYTVEDMKYDEVCCYLTEDVLSMIRNNRFNRFLVAGEDGNVKYEYIENTDSVYAQVNSGMSFSLKMEMSNLPNQQLEKENELMNSNYELFIPSAEEYQKHQSSDIEHHVTLGGTQWGLPLRNENVQLLIEIESLPKRCTTLLIQRVEGEVATRAQSLGYQLFVHYDDTKENPEFILVSTYDADFDLTDTPTYIYDVEAHGTLSNTTFDAYKEAVWIWERCDSIERIQERLDELQTINRLTPNPWIVEHKEAVANAFNIPLEDVTRTVFGCYDTYEELVEKFPLVEEPNYHCLYREIEGKHIFRF